ncbi:SDR family NAD(P)-dependent oxidoreductase [Streptomyces marianii]|uniref:SDR family NAD(P)-dependent oxidoreductase n=1 Tax=Streptomyces marianii TaxID=1817406 RepID=UPI0014864316|nr:SDR family oxidoreductase [Streptomyces marianii]
MTSHPSSSAPLAVVTGGSGALGTAIRSRLAKDGWRLISTYRTRPPEPAPPAGHTTWVRFDTADDTSTGALREAVTAQPGRLHAVFACVGAPSGKRPVAETSLSEFAAVHEANTLSLVSTWHAVADRARRDSTTVLAVGSDAGQAARANNGPYSAAKAALEALVTTLAKEEHQHGVRVNLIAPSLIDSPLAAHVMALKGVTDPDEYFAQLPWGRPLALDEVAAACIEFATAAHWSYVTGQVYPLGALR